jgi:hypothetical protein
MAPPTPLDRHATAVDALQEAERLPLGSAGRTDALLVAQVNALLALFDVVGYAMTPRRVVLGAMPEPIPTALLAGTDSAPILALPNDEDAILGLTHPPKAPRRPRTPKPKLSEPEAAVYLGDEFSAPVNE